MQRENSRERVAANPLASARAPKSSLPSWLENLDGSISIRDLSLDDRAKIKSILLDAARRCWTSRDLTSNEGFQALSSPDAMRLAFNSIAQLLFEQELLTWSRLDEISLLVWESARVGGWLTITPELRAEFGRQFGHDGVWSDEDALFRAEAAKWKGKLLTSEPRILQIGGPDDCYFLIEPSPDGYTWRLHNDGLAAVKKIRIIIAGVQSFHAEKRAFRERESCNAQIPQIFELKPGLSKPEMFVTFEDGKLRLGQHLRSGVLVWPGGSDRSAQVWLVHVQVTGLSQKWSFRIGLRWMPGTKMIEVSDGSSVSSFDESTVRRRGRGSLLDRLSPEDPNYEIAKPAVLEAWADSHGFVAETYAGRVLFRLSWKWRERSAVKITERTHEEATQALHRRREGRHPEAPFVGRSSGLGIV